MLCVVCFNVRLQFKIWNWDLTHNYLVSEANVVFSAWTKLQILRHQTISRIHLASLASAAIYFSSVRRHRYFYDLHLLGSKRMRDVSWENSCHQLHDSTHQHQNQKHQIYSLLMTTVSVSISLLMAQSQHKDEWLLKIVEFASQCWRTVRVSFFSSPIIAWYRNHSTQKAKINKKTFNNLNK